MKMEREHIVPLSPAVVAVLADLRKLSAGAYVFPGNKLSRGIASTWANEAECYRRGRIEMALAHVERDARGAYNSALYLTLRRQMLQAWADTVMGMIDAVPDHHAAPILGTMAVESVLVA